MAVQNTPAAGTRRRLTFEQGLSDADRRELEARSRTLANRERQTWNTTLDVILIEHEMFGHDIEFDGDIRAAVEAHQAEGPAR